MDIMTFFPVTPPGRIYNAQMQRVQISCLVPGSVTEGSREKASVESVLENYNIPGGAGGDGQTADTENAGVRTLSQKMEMWALVAWVFGVGLASTL